MSYQMRNYSITTYLILINCLCLYSQADNYNNLSEYYLTYEIAANVGDENFEKNIGLCEDLIRNENYKIDRGLAACAISYVVEGDTINAHRVINRITPKMKRALMNNPILSEHISLDTIADDKCALFDKSLAEEYVLMFIEDQGSFRQNGTIYLNEKTTLKLQNQGFGHLFEKARNLPGIVINRNNHEKIDSLFSNYGMPSIHQIGYYGMYGIYLTILHSNLTNLEKYDAFVKENYLPKKYGYLIDKKKVAMKLPQVYGTQGEHDSLLGKIIFYELEDPKHVYCRRMKVGMMPISQYAKGLGISAIDIPVQHDCDCQDMK